MNLVSLSFLEFVFGLSSLLGFALAVYIHFKSKAEIHTLIERLRASRANFIQIEAQVDRIIMINESKDKKLEEKVEVLRHVARAISGRNHTNINTIDHGVDWSNLSPKRILESIER